MRKVFFVTQNVNENCPHEYEVYRYTKTPDTPTVIQTSFSVDLLGNHILHFHNLPFGACIRVLSVDCLSMPVNAGRTGNKSMTQRCFKLLFEDDLLSRTVRGLHQTE